MTNPSVANILSLYKSTKIDTTQNLELELRFGKISLSQFTVILNCFKTQGKCEIEQSLNAITESSIGQFGGHKIRQQIFDAGVKIKDSYHEKIQLYNTPMKGTMQYRIVLSKESVVPEFKSIITPQMRFKLRLSIELGNWRMDLTAVKSSLLKDLPANMLVILRDKMFKTPVNSADDVATQFLTQVKASPADSYEMELEWVGNRNDIKESDLHVVESIFKCFNADPTHNQILTDEIYTVARFITSDPLRLQKFQRGKDGVKHLTNKTLTLDTNIYKNIFPPNDYYATEKADGTRCIAVLNGNRLRVLTNILTEYTAGDYRPGDITIIDCELLAGEPTTLLVFDVIVLKNDPIADRPFSERITHIDSAVKIINEFAKELKVIAIGKQFVKLHTADLEKQLRSIYEKKYKYNIDGIIMTTPNKAYSETISFKWKPANHMTIDFLAVKVPEKLIGVKPLVRKAGHRLYVLFCGITYKYYKSLGLSLIHGYNDILKNILPPGFEPSPDYHSAGYHFPIQFSPSSDPEAFILYLPDNIEEIDGKIVELVKDSGDSDWKFIKVRKDRIGEPNYYGNEFSTAELNYQVYYSPLELSDLWVPNFGYFTKLASESFKATNKYKRYVVQSLVSTNLRKSMWLIDLGGGRGADIYAYQSAEIKNVLFVDIDRNAIMELISRKFSIAEKLIPKIKPETLGGGNMPYKAQYNPIAVGPTIHTLIADLSAKPEVIHAYDDKFKLAPEEAEGVVMNFVFHYLCDTTDHLSNIIHTISGYLKVGGLFIMSVMNGETIFNLLSGVPEGSKWQIMEKDVLKYGFEKRYNSNKMANVGQKIAVKLPFTDTWIEEPLVNINYIIKQFTKYGFALELNNNFMDKFDDFSNSFKDLKLSSEDKKYIELHQYLSFRKIKKIK